MNTFIYSIKPLLGKKSSASQTKSFFSKGEDGDKLSEVK